MGTWLKRIGLGALALVVLCTVVVFAVDAHVRSSAGPRIVSADEAAGARRRGLRAGARMRGASRRVSE